MYFLTQGLNMLKIAKWIVAILLLPVMVIVEFWRAIQKAGIEFGSPDDLIDGISSDMAKKAPKNAGKSPKKSKKSKKSKKGQEYEIVT
jgi:hypothetical protein